MEIRFARVFSFALLVISVLAPSAYAGYPVMVPTLQPYKVSSADGTWLLDVKPTHRYGSGPSSVTLIHQKTGEVAWKQELPFTYWQCCVNNDGHVGGYGYTKGPMGGDPWGEEGGDFIVRILDPKGVVEYAETTSRGMGPMIHIGTPSVSARWLIHDSISDNMVIVMANDTLRIYSLRSGSLESALPSIKRENSKIYDDLAEIRFIGDPRLMLLRYSSWDSSENDETFGSKFVLINFEGHVIWSLDKIQTLPKIENRVYPKYTIRSTSTPNEVDPFAPLKEVPSQPGAAPTLISIGDFELFLGDGGEKVTYNLAKNHDENNPTWTVAETAREKHALPAEPNEEEIPAPKFPQISAEKLSGFHLSISNKRNLGELAAVTVSADGKIYALETETRSLHIFDASGKFLQTCKTTDGRMLEAGWHNASLAVTSSGDVLVKQESDSTEANYLRFDTKGKLKEEKLEFSSGYAEQIVARPHPMSFVSHGFGKEITTISFEGHDRNGSFRRLTHRADGQWLDYIGDVACAEDGTIAVRDCSAGDDFAGFETPFSRLPNSLPAETVTIYSAEGEPLRTLDFTAYAALNRIAFGGGHIIATGNFFPSQPRIYVFTDKGLPLGAFDAEIPAKDNQIDLRLFLVSQGKEIVVVDKRSAKVLRYKMPKPSP